MKIDKRKIITGWQILRVRGFKSFCKAVALFLHSQLRASNLDESKIAYQVLVHQHKHGVMIDVGAHYGGSLEPFANAGWQVFAFEPDTSNLRILRQGFGKYDNVVIDSRCVSNVVKSNVPFYSSEVSSGISGLSAFHSSHIQTREVDTVTLDVFCRDHQITIVDYLKIDTEGFDYFVLQGVPWEMLRPRLILCEFENTKTVPLGYSFHDMARFLQSCGYAVLVSEWFPVQQYGGIHSWRRFAKYPAELEDQDACGNLFACSDLALFEQLLAECRVFQHII
jgi:FkbM family methyltransferase